jgi:hypothetical protein
MLSSYAEKTLAKILGYGSALTALLVLSSSVTDPVNAPKLAALGVVAAAGLGIVLSGLKSLGGKTLIIPGLIALIFLASIVNAVAFSDSPVSQNLYGVYGRNNGLVSYVFLSIIFLCASALTKVSSFDYVSKGLLLAGTINVIYCGWVILFGDFIGWNNPYGNILGTFGNPNFIGAFLGIFLSAYVAYALSSQRSAVWRWSLIAIIPITAFEIVDSSAIQGRVVAAGGLALVAFSYLRYKLRSVFLWVYSLTIITIGLFAVSGALQIGPFTQYVYKTSVSLRGQYWLAGWNAGDSNPFTGLGMDALGDWYRRVRDPQAIILPGVNTVVNAAHNVFMDMFAFGGWPLLLAYVAMVILSAVALIRTFLRLKEYDGLFTAISVAWIGYQVQSLISINQIGLAIWGWLLGGTLIAYERVTRPTRPLTTLASGTTNVKRGEPRKTSKVSDPRTLVTSFVAALIGLMIALPPLVADSKWKSALNGQSVAAIEETMKPSYFNPQNVNKYVTNIQLLEKNNLQDLAHKYALEAVKWNPQAYDLWRFVYFISKSTSAEREFALSKMKELDPLNPDVTAQ